jgi:hypothetical protein
MTILEDDLQGRLDRLRDATDAVAPGAHFVDAVMNRLDAECHIGWREPLQRLGPRFLAVAALVAGLAIAWGYGSSRPLDESLIAADYSSEVDWW